MIKIVINGKEILAEKNQTILEVAKENGIHIPTLCHDDRLSDFGGCRMCLVEIKGSNKLHTSCSTKIWNGMEVETENKKINKIRKNIVDLLVSNHPMDCLTCEQVGECDLQDLAYEYGIKEGSYKGEKTVYAIDSINPVMERNPSKCIMCGKCVRVCKEIQVTDAIDFVGRGFDSVVNTPFNDSINHDNCRLCGQCISVCPTGALTNKDFKNIRPWEIEEKVTTTCPFCGTGCTFDLNVKDGKVVGVTPHSGSVVNDKSMCVKGRFHTDFISNPDRITKPLIKKDGKFVETSWSHAINYVARNLKEIRDTYGGDSIAGLSSARCTNEENYLFQKMMRAALETNNVDHCART